MFMLKKDVANILQLAINTYIKEQDINEKILAEIEYAADDKFGDYACTTALKMAKLLKKNPIEIAKGIVSKIDSENFSSVSVAPPGFINITLSEKYINETVNNVLFNENYGKNIIEEKLNILLEYISANPTGPLHIGHGRWAAIGSALSNLLKYVGHNVYNEFYVNDAGEQINKLNASVEAVRNNKEVPEDGYHGEYIKEIAKLDGNPKDIMLKNQQELLERFKSNIDNYASEKAIKDTGALEIVIETLKDKGLIFEKDNALWFKSSEFGDDKDRVLKKSSGEYTYFAPDITYHKTKIDRGYNYLIDILGADHHGYVSRITAAVRALSDDKVKLNVILGQLVRLYRGAELVRMSKRTGEMITLEEVIDEIGVDSTRYFLLMRSPQTSLDFDLELAKKKDNDNPVYYVQYAYARICNIFIKLGEKGLSFEKDKPLDISKIANADSLKLAKMLIRLPDELLESAKAFEVYTLINYMYELSSVLHRFYYNNVVLESDDTIRQERLTLILAVKKVLGILFDIIGITKLERMWLDEEQKEDSSKEELK